MYVGDGDTANTVYEDVVFVASVGADGEVAGPADAVEGRAGVMWRWERGSGPSIVASVAATSSW
jgi:hypothetical protein